MLLAPVMSRGAKGGKEKVFLCTNLLSASTIIALFKFRLVKAYQEDFVKAFKLHTANAKGGNVAKCSTYLYIYTTKVKRKNKQNVEGMFP